MKYDTITKKLCNNLDSIVEDLASLLNEVSIHRTGELNIPGVTVIAFIPDYHWDEPTPQQRNSQILLKRRYDQFCEMLRLILGKAPKDLLNKLDDVEDKFRIWLELKQNWALTLNRASNLAKFKEDVKEIRDILDIVNSSPTTATIIIPDTNSLLESPDPIRYREILKKNEFIFMILPTVLGELDSLKMRHNNPAVREKAIKAIDRIKGWRNQGNVRDGIIVDKTIIVKVNYNEPDMKLTLSWLDENTKDDRIIASVLSVQSDYPVSEIVFFTKDINLQIKADAAYINVAEI